MRRLHWKWVPCIALSLSMVCAPSALGRASAPDILPAASPTAAAQPLRATGATADVSQAPVATATPMPTPKPWTFALSKQALEDPEGYMRMVNVHSLLEKDYVPNDLEKATVRKTSSTTMQLRAAAHSAMKAMFDDAKADGITLYLHSAYRSYQTQNTMYKNRLASIGYDDKVVTQPGASDHQTGLGADIISKAWIGKKFNRKFAETKEAQWMAENCARYGFIIRYPDGKEDITEIIFEPWHLRYVGVDAAQYIMGHGLTLEEFELEAEQAISDYLTGASSDVPAEGTADENQTDDGAEDGGDTWSTSVSIGG